MLTEAAPDAYLAPTYRRPNLVFERGEGVWLYDTDGRRYLDALAGIAVNALGYADPEVVKALRDGAGGLIHVSNLFHTTPHLELARELCEHSFADRVFFCNSGTEAVEGALKMARLATGKTGFVAFEGSFHGRTMGALSVTSTAKYRAPFEPLVPGARFVPFGDFAAAEAAIGGDTAAVIVEPVQGEGGIRPAPPGFLAHLRARCDAVGAALIVDEVQCGLGRTGTLWAHQAHAAIPDVMTLAKPLGAGLPIGAILMRESIAGKLQPGDHGSTFAGGPLVCSVARVVLRRVAQPAFLRHVQETGAYLGERLRGLVPGSVVEVRGCGLMWGVQLREEVPAASAVDACLARGVVVGASGGNTVRLVPPLIVERAQVDMLVDALDEVLGGLQP